MDTIVALSSGSLPSGVAVIRLSGPAVSHVVRSICGELPEARVARYGALKSASGEVLDRGLSIFFPGPASFTGEDCAELHVHGGRAVVGAILEEIVRRPSCRMAEAGEFTRRAFLNGKINLLDAESMADLLSAETEAQRRLALQGTRNAPLYEEWRGRLIRIRAFVEAELDFADEGDVPDDASKRVWDDARALAADMEHHLGGYRKAELVREGFDVVLMGAPNVGKSSLLNALAKREAAIVSDEPGTTRDLVEVNLDLGGFKVRITDTAGIREADGKVERIGIERAIARAGESALVLLLDDGTETRAAVPAGPEVLVVGTKADVGNGRPTHCDLQVSARSGEGLDALVSALEKRAVAAAPGRGELLPWRLRQTDLLSETVTNLRNALSETADMEVRSEHLRLASNALGRITGAVDVEDLLDVIFAQFCVGK